VGFNYPCLQGDMYIYKGQRRGSLEGKGLNQSINQSINEIKHQSKKEKSWSEKNPLPLQRKFFWKEQKVN